MKNQSFYNNQPDNSQLLKHLIRFPFFKNELVSKKNLSQINQIYIIKKEIIKTLKEKYFLKELYIIFSKKIKYYMELIIIIAILMIKKFYNFYIKILICSSTV